MANQLFETSGVLKKCGMVPRPYQVEDFDNSFAMWNDGHVGTLSRLFTGAGKTLAACMKFERWLKQPNAKCLVISYEKQLVWQFAQEIEDILGFKPGIEMEKEHCRHGKIQDIVVASRQTLMRHKLATEEQRDVLADYGIEVGERLLSKSNATRAIKKLRDSEIDTFTIDSEIDQFQEHWMCDHTTGTISRLHKFDCEADWLVCFDEAHKYARKLVTVGHIVEWFERNQNHRRFGLTATPRRSDGTTIKNLFPEVSVDMSLARGIREGWSVPMDQKFIRIEEINFTDIKKIAGNSQRKCDKEVAKLLEEKLAEMCIPLLELTGTMRTLAFFPSVKLVQEAVAFINARKPGSAVGVWGEINPQERQRIYQQHKRGLVQYLFACGLCKESYNDQAIMCVAIFRMIRRIAISLAEQMKGRGGRVLPGVIDGLDTPEERKKAIAASAKPSVLIIDLVGASGLTDCATTMQIYAEGMPDDVVARAEEISLIGGIPPEECIEQAERDIQAEKEEHARRIQEEKEELERAAKARAEAKVSVKYSVHSRGITDADPYRDPKLASEKQRRYLWVLGFKNIDEFAPAGMCKD